ncbi:unnamed protein product [Plutella xylostella]|uniref:(diamondback moth) hypothetical protein n=1 Tax=Plutella xylostella TaxID=51655 RepID=A0A8S4G3R6_PLUXY|nr:unnamed protein product [Plutella xylostella]
MKLDDESERCGSCWEHASRPSYSAPRVCPAARIDREGKVVKTEEKMDATENGAAAKAK